MCTNLRRRVSPVIARSATRAFPALLACAFMWSLLATEAVAQGTHHGSEAGAAQSKRKLCVVKRRDSKNRLRTVYTTTLAYKRVRRGGRTVRRIVKRRVAMRAPCSARCVVLRNRSGKLVTVYVTRRVSVKIKRRNRIVTVKRRRRVPKLGKCVRAPVATVLGTPVTITLREGSVGVLDFSSFVREAPLTGTVKGYSPGQIDIAKDTAIILTSGRIDVAPTAIFIDDECNGDVTAAVRTGEGTHAQIDTSGTNTATLTGGDITSIVTVRLRTPIELRNGELGCNEEYLKTGYTQVRLRLNLFGELDTSRGILAANLVSAPSLLDDFDACLELGDPKRPCSGITIPFPFLLSTKIFGELSFGKYGEVPVGGAASG